MATVRPISSVVMALLLLGVGLWLRSVEDWQSYAPTAGGATRGEVGHAAEKPSGVVRWLTTVDHKDVGLLYGVFALLSFAWGGIAVVLMRTELVTPPVDLLGAKFYNALMTTHGITMLFCVGFVANSIVGGVTGVFEAAVPVDLVLHDTYHVIAHFHYVILGAIAFAVFAAVYYWFPLYTGWWYQATLARWHFWLSMVGTQLTFFPMIVLGYGGMPRRYAGYDLTAGPAAYFADLHQLATVGVYLLALGQLVFVWNVVTSWLEGPRVEGGDPWDLEADGLAPTSGRGSRASGGPRRATRRWRWPTAARWPTVTR